MDIHGYPWVIQKGGRGGRGQQIDILPYRWEFPAQLGGLPGSIKDHFKHEF